jgi:alpha/beta hydrolase family protein
MNTPCNFPYFEIEVDKDGQFVTASQVDDVINFVKSKAGAVKDLFVISHGWNNDMADARDLYERFFTELCKAFAQNASTGISANQCAVAGILWPSKKFADIELIPGGAAAVEADPSLVRALDQLEELADNPAAKSRIEKAKQQLTDLEDDPGAQKAFVDQIRSLLPNKTDGEEGLHPGFFKMEGDDLLENLSEPLPLVTTASDDPTEGGAADIGVADLNIGDEEGEAQSLSSILSGIKGGAMRLLNFTTYYLMKDRAGKVGSGAVAQVLSRIQNESPTLRIHLVGHSFGCRVVTAAIANAPKPVASMTLLQAAFSHNSFSPDFDANHKPGAFRSVIAPGKVTGPILISHTVKDRAVGVAYAVASRIARQNGAAVGDANDPYGGLGRNGAQHTPEAKDGELLPVAGKYSLVAPTKIFNLKADSIIGGHSDVVKPEVAYALLQAAGLGK